MVNAAGRRLALLAVLAMTIFFTGGCVRVATHLLAAYLSDPRTRNHAYTLKVEIRFDLHGRTVTAVRYAEVGYLTGSGETSYWPPCNRDKRGCWYITNHYFIGLPGGDIMDIYLDSNALPLDHWPDGTMPGEARLTNILRDQPPSPDRDSQGTCQSLDADAVQRAYGYPVKGTNQSDVPYDVTLTRVPERQAKIIDPESISMAVIVDEVSCKRLHNRLSTGVTITP